MSSSDAIEKSLVAHKAKWSSFGLDPRVERAITKLGWSNPTLVQNHTIPLALQGKDILAKARTGSGKTAAYAVPVIQKILSDKEGTNVAPGIRALILVPTRELCEQVSDVITKLVAYCHHLVRHVFIASDTPMESQKHKLKEIPDIVIATPGRLVQHLEKGNLTINKSLKMIVIDEADLVLSYGYEKDVEKICKFLPKICQGFLASATLSSEVDQLKKLILHTPFIVKLEEEKNQKNLLQQFLVLNPKRGERFLQLYVLIKLKLLTGKTIIFVNTIEDCYKLKLFLERMSIKSAVLNSELPQNSRYHIVQEFNKGLFSILIATDEANKGEADDSDDESSESENEQNENESENESKEEPKKDKNKMKESSNKKNKKGKEESSESEDENEENEEMESFEENGDKSDQSDQSDQSDDENNQSDDDSDEDKVIDGDEIFENLGSSDDDDSDNDSDDDEQTVAAAKQAAEEAIGEIDAIKSVNKNAMKLITSKLKKLNEAQERENLLNNDDDDSDDSEDENENAGKSKNKKKRNTFGGKKRMDSEYGVSRGVDFRGIQTVINFDFPRSSRAYTHRVGRTARAGQSGIALSFASAKKDAAMVAKVTAKQKAAGNEIKPYIFHTAALDNFRYRVEGVLRTVTELAIREARYEEIRREILGSEKLQTFFEENPRELELLKHDKSLLQDRINPRLKIVPDYILSQKPSSMLEPLPLKPRDQDEEYLEHFGRRRTKFGKKRLATDPLQNFSAKRHKGNDGKMRRKSLSQQGPGTAQFSRRKSKQ